MFAVKTISTIYLKYYPRAFTLALSKSIAPEPIISIISERISFIVTFLTTMILGIGYLLLLYKKKLRKMDYAIFISGMLYACFGLIVYIVGHRGFLIMSISAPLGIIYYIQSKYGKYFKSFFLIIIILFTFNPLNSTFYDYEILYQTKEEYQVATFMINYYNWNKPSYLLSHLRFRQYLRMRTASEVFFGNDFDVENIYNSKFPKNVVNYDYVIYTIGLGKSFLRHNSSMETILYEYRYNRLFDSSFSYIVKQ